MPPLGASPSSLTLGQRAILRYAAEGLGAGAIAARLGCNVDMIRRHLAGAISILDARSVPEAVEVATRRGLIGPAELAATASLGEVRGVPFELEALADREALGPLEREVAALIAEGLADGAIDSRLGIAPGATATYVEAARRRLERRIRVHLARWALDRPLLR